MFARPRNDPRWSGRKFTIRSARRWLSTLLAAVPIVVLLGLLAAGQRALRGAWRAWRWRWPWRSLASACRRRQLWRRPCTALRFGLVPMGWIVLAAVFLFHLTVRTGQFEIVKQSVAAISPDRRMQALLIAFCFGTFIEGAAGFGTPVAISAALLIGLGFSPLYAAGLALMANTSPVAFGALGTPITTLAKISGHRRDGLMPDGRPAVAAVFADRAGLARGHDGRLARSVGCWPAIWCAAAASPGCSF